MVQDDAEDQYVQLGHDEAQQGHGKLRGHAQEDLVHGGKTQDHGGKLLLEYGGKPLLVHGGEDQLDGGLDEGEDLGHCGAVPGDEVPENKSINVCV